MAREPPPVMPEMSRQSMMEATPPAMPSARLSLASREPPALPATRPRAASRQRQPSAASAAQRRRPPPQQQQAQAQPEPRRAAATGRSSGWGWTCVRLSSFGVGAVLGLVVPLGLAAFLWSTQAIGWDGTRPEGADGSATDAASSATAESLWERHPVNVVTGAVLFGALSWVWAHGAGTEVAWVSKAINGAQREADRKKRRSATTEALQTKARAVGWGALIFALVGAGAGATIVLFVLSEHTRRGGTIFLATLLGAGSLGPLGASIGSGLEAVEKSSSGSLDQQHWAEAMRVHGGPSRCLAWCMTCLARLPCWCGLFKVPGPERDEQGKPIKVPSPRLMLTWLMTLLGGVGFALLGVAITAWVSEGAEASVSDLLGVDVSSTDVGVDVAANASAANTTTVTRVDEVLYWVMGVDASLRPHFRQLRREREAYFEGDMTQVMLLAICSLFWDVVVLWYHVVTAPHPKFRLRPLRRISIYTHICAGLGEIVVSVLAFVLYCDSGEFAADGLEVEVGDGRILQEGGVGTCTETEQDRSLLLVYGHVFCAVVHMITAAYQTPQVFGMQIVMVPAYTAVVLWKAVSALRLALQPSSLWLLVQLFFAHHIYVWCRAMHGATQRQQRTRSFAPPSDGCSLRLQ